jgi:hypothetical protein
MHFMATTSLSTTPAPYSDGPRSPGRPPKDGEVLSEQLPVKLGPTMHSELVAESKRHGMSAAEYMRRATNARLHPSSRSIEEETDFVAPL